LREKERDWDFEDGLEEEREESLLERYLERLGLSEKSGRRVGR